MRCPKCRSIESKVTDTRVSTDGETIKRRRLCLSCGHRFCTFERVEIDFPCVIKRDGTVVEFDSLKIANSLRKAMDKEQCSDEIINKMTSKILSQIVELGDDKIHSKAIGAMILEELKCAYPVAYIRFASVYKNFKSTEEFTSECNFVDGLRK